MPGAGQRVWSKGPDVSTSGVERILASNPKVDEGRQCTVTGASRKVICKGRKVGWWGSRRALGRHLDGLDPFDISTRLRIE